MVVAKSLMTECAKNYFPFKDMVEKSSFFFWIGLDSWGKPQDVWAGHNKVLDKEKSKSW